MTRQPIAVVALPQGPRDPVATTPPRRPGSVRRTTTIDQRRGEPGHPQDVVACGRDLRTLADGTPEVVDQVSVRATVDGLGTVTAIESDPPVPGLRALVGGHVSKGLRARVDELLPDHAEAATVLHQLLDDLPMATLISGYGAAREREDWVLPEGAAERMTDLCAGWAGGATMLAVLERTGAFPIPIGPPAPDLQPADDPLAWHDLPPMAPRSVRRRRRLDLVAGEPLELDVHFRDSHLGADGLEDVLHEYTLAATVAPGMLTVGTATATARVLPWPECPGALASAARAIGAPVRTLRQTVAADFRGTATCTHLNDVLRSVAGVSALAAALPR